MGGTGETGPREGEDSRPSSRGDGNLLFSIFGTYVLPAPRLVWSGGLVQVLGDFGYSKAASRIALSRLVRKGFLAPTKEGRRVFFEMAPQLVALLQEGERRIFSFGRSEPESGPWTFLSYSIPEGMRGDRDRLRKRLAFLGFVSLNDGFWLSTRDRVDAVRATIEQMGLEQYADVFVGLPADMDAASGIIARAWKDDELVRLYGEFLAAYEGHGEPRALLRLSDREAFVVRTSVIHAFRRFPRLDPEFPDPTLQQLRRDAIACFDRVYGELAELAQSYFDRLTATETPAPGDRSTARASRRR